MRTTTDRARPARRAPRFRRAAPDPPLRRTPRGSWQRRQHTKRRWRHHHRPQLHRVPALRTPKADHSKDPPVQGAPRSPARPPLRTLRKALPHRRRSLLRLRWRRSNACPKPRTRRQNTVIVNLVRPRWRHQRHQAFDKLQPAQLQGGGPITPGALQCNPHPTIRQRLHSLLRKRRARDVPAELFEPPPVPRPDDDPRMHRVSVIPAISETYAMMAKMLGDSSRQYGQVRSGLRPGRLKRRGALVCRASNEPTDG